VQGEGQQGHRMDTLQRFPPDLVLRKKQKIIFDVRPAGAGTTTTPPISYAIIASRSLRCCTRPVHNRPVRVPSGPRRHERWRAKPWTV
jgi:hypothetical protein